MIRLTGHANSAVRRIGSYSRAQELLRQGYSYLDGDGDGEACESLRPTGRLLAVPAELLDGQDRQKLLVAWLRGEE